MGLRLVTGLLALVLVGVATGIATASTEPSLVAKGPTEVAGTEATAVFRVGDRTVRQVRYADRERLRYTFTLANQGRLPVTVTGLGPLEERPMLFEYLTITDRQGNEEFTIGAGKSERVTVTMLMTACENLSARAGSFATRVNLLVSRAGVLTDEVQVAFPEEVHTGSPREARCPNATATSRSPG